MGLIQLPALKRLLPLEMPLGDNCFWLADVMQDLWELLGLLWRWLEEVEHPGCRRWSLYV